MLPEWAIVFIFCIIYFQNNLSTVTDLNNPSPPTTSVQCSSPPRLKADSDEKAEDFHSRQEQLQNEAKLALAQVSLSL